MSVYYVSAYTDTEPPYAEDFYSDEEPECECGSHDLIAEYTPGVDPLMRCQQCRSASPEAESRHFTWIVGLHGDFEPTLKDDSPL